METKLDLVLRSFAEDSNLDNFSEGSKLSTALKVAGVAGAVGALGAGALAGNAILDKVGDVAGDALGKVGDVTKEVLSNSSRVGKAVKAAKAVSGAMKG